MSPPVGFEELFEDVSVVERAGAGAGEIENALPGVCLDGRIHPDEENCAAARRLAWLAQRALKWNPLEGEKLRQLYA